MPTITAGHDYLLMVTNWSKSTFGYDLTFGGGTAVITDPKEPHLQSSRAICDGTQAVIRTNKRMKCNSLSANGSEFVITPNVATVIGAVGYGCSNGFDMDSVILTLSNPLPPGTYTIAIKNGTDGNTLRDNCDRLVPEFESVPMIVFPQFPTPMNMIDAVGCAPGELVINFSDELRYIRCNSIAPDGSDFAITMISGTAPAAIVGAAGICRCQRVNTGDKSKTGRTYSNKRSVPDTINTQQKRR